MSRQQLTHLQGSLVVCNLQQQYSAHPNLTHIAPLLSQALTLYADALFAKEEFKHAAVCIQTDTTNI